MTDDTQPAAARPVTVPFDLAFRLDLEQQRKQAKELLQSFRAGHAAAEQRFQLHYPARSGNRDPAARPVTRSDARDAEPD